jgi:TRAP-type C4-dicarboxylate transport system permease small subunit
MGGYMKRFLAMLNKLSSWMNAVGGSILVLMMLLTSADVILRFFGRPITGTYELIALAGALVVAFAIPQTTRDNANIAVDFFVEGRSQSIRNIMFVVTKVMGVTLFVLLAWYLFEKANVLYKDGFVTSTLKFPFYPVAYGLSICCLVESIILLGEIFGRFYREAKHE